MHIWNTYNVVIFFWLMTTKCGFSKDYFHFIILTNKFSSKIFWFYPFSPPHTPYWCTKFSCFSNCDVCLPYIKLCWNHWPKNFIRIFKHKSIPNIILFKSLKAILVKKVLYCIGGIYLRIFHNSIISAYVPKKNSTTP